jgi:hypothetical protein
MTRKIKRGGKVWINIFPDKPVTQKPAETRMGSGKGSPEHWVAVVKPGRVMFELAGVPEQLAKEALRLAGTKLSVRTEGREAGGGSASNEGPASSRHERRRADAATSRRSGRSSSTCGSSPRPARSRTARACGSPSARSPAS